MVEEKERERQADSLGHSPAEWWVTEQRNWLGCKAPPSSGCKRETAPDALVLAPCC